MQLYFFHSNTCPACKAALPDVLAAAVKRLDFTPIFRVIDDSSDGRDVIEGFKPKMTPAYALVSGDELLATHQGKLTGPQLNKFLDDAKAVIAARAADFYTSVKAKPRRGAHK